MAIPATRSTIGDPLAAGPVDNAGLALDRYLADAEDKDAQRRLFDRVVEPPPAAVSDLYAAAYIRWESELRLLPNVEMRRFQVQGRMIVGIGGDSVQEMSITLHRNYGMPYVPGSALKGLARHYAQRAVVAGADPHDLRDTGGATPNAYSVLFGHQQSAARVRYFDAWYIPDQDTSKTPLHRDVVTVHHPDYYGSQGRTRAPWDFDDPTPVPFLSASGGYLVAVQGPTADWAAFAAELLTHALDQWGIGAKTASGYGRMRWADRPQLREPHAAAIRVRDLPSNRLFQDLKPAYEEAKALPDLDRQDVYQAIEERLSRTDSMRNWGRKQRWVAEMQASPRSGAPGA